MVWLYEIKDLVYPEGIDFNTKDMIKYAKKCLSINKTVHNLDLELKSSDLSDSLNAWVYLCNIGIGVDTNRPEWSKDNDVMF